jgi:hypothetical protein
VGSAILALLVSGCGASSPKPISMAQFTSQANAICTREDQRFKSAESSLGANPSDAQEEAFFTSTIVPSIQSQISSLRTLAARTSESTSLDKMLAVAQSELDSAAGDPSALSSGTDPFAGFDRLAKPYGLTSCG